MLIHLKRNERLYLNGAVVRLDRRATIELMNDAQFLLETHILQPECAATPLRQLYFIVQIMIMDPPNAYLTMQLFNKHTAQMRATASGKDYNKIIDEVEERVESGNYFDAMKTLRQGFSIEDKLLAEDVSPSGSGLEAA